MDFSPSGARYGFFLPSLLMLHNTLNFFPLLFPMRTVALFLESFFPSGFSLFRNTRRTGYHDPKFPMFFLRKSNGRYFFFLFMTRCDGLRSFLSLIRVTCPVDLFFLPQNFAGLEFLSVKSSFFSFRCQSSGH